jgi:hypothetical protein
MQREKNRTENHFSSVVLDPCWKKDEYSRISKIIIQSLKLKNKKNEEKNIILLSIFLYALLDILFLLCFFIMLNCKPFYRYKVLDNQRIKLIKENSYMNMNCIMPTKLID